MVAQLPDPRNFPDSVFVSTAHIPHLPDIFFLAGLDGHKSLMHECKCCTSMGIVKLVLNVGCRTVPHMHKHNTATDILCRHPFYYEVNGLALLPTMRALVA